MLWKKICILQQTTEGEGGTQRGYVPVGRHLLILLKDSSLFSMPHSHLNRSYTRGSALKGLKVYLCFTILTPFKDFPPVAFTGTEIISFLTFTCSTSAVRRVRIPSPTHLTTRCQPLALSSNSSNAGKVRSQNEDNSSLVPEQGKVEFQLSPDRTHRSVHLLSTCENE